jgi:acyl-CoA dehydrogenase
MDFKLTTEQLEMKEMAMKFAKNEMIPKAAEYDEEGKFPDGRI